MTSRKIRRVIESLTEDGTREWRLDGKYHREDGPAIIRPDGSEEWYFMGKFHRIGGPAVIRPDGYRSWYLNGDLHREDGPAIEYLNGTKRWFLEGRSLSEEEYLTIDASKYPKLQVYQIMKS